MAFLDKLFGRKKSDDNSADINENDVKSCAELKYRYRPIYDALLDKKLGKSVSYTFIYNKDNLALRLLP